jgi:preprotein translocase subunit SecD
MIASIAGLMVVLMWIFSMYRLWLVWAHKLNFDGVCENLQLTGV